MKPIIKFFSSLELTIACFALAMVLIFFGTLDQTNLGIHGAIEKYFYSVFVYHHFEGPDLYIPYMPGGYLVGFVLLVNLLTVIVYRFRFSRKKAGIWLIHIGVILLLLGEFISSVFQNDARMTISEGDTVNWAESSRESELALTDRSGEETDRVYAIPQIMLEREQLVEIDELPFTVSVDQFFANSLIQSRDSESLPEGMKLASRGFGLSQIALEVPKTGKMNERNIPAVVVTLFDDSTLNEDPKIIGTWLVTEWESLGGMPPQRFTFNDRVYTIEMRLAREYLPYRITLVDFRHDKYPGTNTPKNFSSDIIVKNDLTGEEREFHIKMNEPLRYADRSFYQHSFMSDEITSILQVVKNPGRLFPYISCSLITLGLVVQFVVSLERFSQRRRKQAA